MKEIGTAAKIVLGNSHIINQFDNTTIVDVDLLRCPHITTTATLYLPRPIFERILYLLYLVYCQLFKTLNAHLEDYVQIIIDLVLIQPK